MAFGGGFLSGFLGGAGGQMGGGDPFGMELSQPQQPDMLQYQAAHNTQQDVPQSQFLGEMPAQRSWFQNLMSGAIVGLAGGGNAPDAATAFGRGYLAVMQQRQAEIQQARQQAQFEQQQYLWQSQRAKDNIDMMEKWQKMQYYPKEMQQKMLEANAQLITAMHGAGYRPSMIIPDDPAAATEALKATDGKVMSNANLKGPDGSIYSFELNPNDQTTTQQDVTIPFPNIPNGITIPAGSPMTAITDMQKKLADSYDTIFEQTRQDARAAASNTTQQNIANTYVNARMNAPSRTSTPQPGNLTDQQKAQVSLLSKQMTDFAARGKQMATSLQSSVYGRLVSLDPNSGKYVASPDADPEVVKKVDELNYYLTQALNYRSQIQGIIGGTPQQQPGYGGPPSPFTAH